MAVTNSPNMGLPIPGVGTQPGPDFAFNVNQALTLLDQHDHSPGKGIQITPAGLNINADLTFNDNNITALQSAVFQAQLSPLTTLQSLYVAPGLESPTPINDLWFTDGVGNQIQITSNGEVNATIASLPGESFAFGTFFWKQGTGSTTPANFDIGSITIRPNVAATTFGVTLSPPSGISSQYTITLPLLPLPGGSAESFLTLTSGGVINDNIPIAGGINTSNLADGSVTLAKLASNILSWNSQTLTTSGSFVVPANVNQVFALGAGGGGGGGGSGGISGIGTTAGGAGGQGAQPMLLAIAVTPGETLTVVIGTGGIAGTAGGTGATGGKGGNGGNTTITKSSNSQIYTFEGAIGGNGSVATTDAQPGRNTPAYNALSDLTYGGNGGNGTAGTGQEAGQISQYWGIASTPGLSNGGSGGTGGGGGGGGGGSGFGTGGNGGNGASGANVGQTSGTAGGISAGGGAGGGRKANAGSVGTAGSAGGAGQLILYWLGAP